MKTQYLLILLFLTILVSGVLVFNCSKVSDPSELMSVHHTCSDHVLKEPYVLYQGDPTGNAVMIHTTSYIPNVGGVVRIKWGTGGNYGSYHDMDKHKFNVGHGDEDYYIWYKSWGHGTFTPNTKIDYKVNVHTAHKDHYFEGWFYTSDDNMQELTFYAFGDTRGCGSNYASIMNSMALDMDLDYSKRYRLIIHTGDVVFNGPRDRYEPWWNNWNTEFFGRGCNNNGGNRGKALWILARVPITTCIGNHDWEWDGHSDKNSTRYYLSTWPYYMYQYVHNTKPINLKNICGTSFTYNKKPEHAYYSFDYGPAHFISLSTYPTNGHDQSTHLSEGSHQYNWLKWNLMGNNKPWTFVFTHIPLYDGGGANNKTAIESCEPLFEQYGVDAVLQGHEHCYVRINVKKGTLNEIPYITLGGGGAPLDYTNPHEKADCYAVKYHYSRFDITNNDSLQVFITEKHLLEPGNIEKFYVKNRPKK